MNDADLGIVYVSPSPNWVNGHNRIKVIALSDRGYSFLEKDYNRIAKEKGWNPPPLTFCQLVYDLGVDWHLTAKDFIQMKANAEKEGLKLQPMGCTVEGA